MKYILVFFLLISGSFFAQNIQIEVVDAQTNARVEEAFIIVKGSSPVKSQNGVFMLKPATLPAECIRYLWICCIWFNLSSNTFV